MKILFLHGWNSIPGGVKPTFLAEHGHEVINPALPDKDFDEAVRIAQAEFDQHHPGVIVGSSRGGAVAMNLEAGSTPLVLLCPAWRKYGSAKTVKPGTVILHSRADDVVPFADSEELVSDSGLPPEMLNEVGTDHRLADPEPLAAMMAACERIVGPTTGLLWVPITESPASPRVMPPEASAFLARLRTQVIPWIEQSTIPFYHLRKDPTTDDYGILDKDRTGILIRIVDDYFILTAAHNVADMVHSGVFLSMSWDDDEHVPIPITKEPIALTDETTLDVAAIKLTPESTAQLLRRHRAISLADVAANCRTLHGVFLIVGYPRAGTEFKEQKWNDPHAHEITNTSLKFVCGRKMDGWKHDSLQYSPHLHIVLGMSPDAVSATTGDSHQLPNHAGIQGISGCGIWHLTDETTKRSLDASGVDDCRLVAIEHSYDEASGRVAGTWIDLALDNIAKAFPQTKAAINLYYPQ